ncbi:protein ECERIFERUM 1-like isoform X2 [Olea europaea var. sylvestris]|uniref:protein ECERIFERUM 1-like isoform X2 n=1 Tax=Olea europaea var. sylvestris TaxID=158386 RepID=UPI000C1D55EB|nr:protein ECERIFERUM 1-like isoform X2 [Olea europaea var. sylvestris]
MASKPGILTDWPWTCLGNFKYLVLAPWAIQETYSFVVSDESERDLSHFLIFPFLLLRMLHSQIWISLSRYHTAKGSNRIVDKTIEFEQVDRERNWDDQIIFNGLLLYLGGMYVKGGDHLPLWRTDGIVLTALLHAGPVEFLYYWLHRALHHHFLYSRYHSHHHSSIATEPITSVIHPFAEHIAYFVLFAIPLYTSVATGTASILSMAIYVIYIDFMNNMGHCNFELIPKWLLSAFPPLKYLMYTPSIYGRTFTIERNVFKHLKLQTWAVPKYKIQYYMQWQRESINNLIEDAILAAEEKGVKVLSLGLLNQQEELNGVGELFVRRHPKLKVKLISGTSLAVAVVLNSVPKGTSQVVLRGNLSKVAYSIALALCQGGIQVTTLREDEYNKLKARLSIEAGKKLVLSKIIASKTWIVGDGLSEDEQLRAPKGTVFIPYSQFPPKKIRKDCFYYNIPAMLAPKHFQNVDSCENWLPRRVMSAWRIAGILHALEDWNVHECGNVMFDIDKIWQASLEHGFTPIMMSTDSKLH